MFTPEQVDRFHNNYTIDPDTQCWNWKRSIDKDGYGNFTISQKGQKTKYYKAHRASLMIQGHKLNWNKYKFNQVVCHSCGNSKCVNPDHLYIGTQKDNIQDTIKHGTAPWMNNPYFNGLQERDSNGRFTGVLKNGL